MGKLKKTILLLLVLLFSSNLFAKQISIQIVQHNSANDQVIEESLAIEDELLNGLFESGFIVTNSPAVVSTSDGQDSKLWSLGVGDAYEGSSDYFVQVKLFYEDQLEKIDMDVVKVSSGKSIKNCSFTDTKIRKEKRKEDLARISSDLIFEIYKAIKA